MRGDEPLNTDDAVQSCIICPTCVGMNRVELQDKLSRINMPHMRGDEPNLGGQPIDEFLYAPHAWG